MAAPKAPIRFYFDFASPYAYLASQNIDRLATQFGRAVEWRPILLWAVFKAHGIAAPMEAPARRAYLLRDMARSAAFHGLPYSEPAKLPFSSHLAARLYHATAANDPAAARLLALRLLEALFGEGLDISDAATLHRIASEFGLSADIAAEAANGPVGRSLLARANEDAVADMVIGSPFFVVDGEGFFGVDRLPQLQWFLARQTS